MSKRIVIVSAVRTPIGSFMGGLSTIPAPKLGAISIQAALEKVKLRPDLIDEVFMGNAIQAGLGQSAARQAALYAGLPNEVICTTVNKVCASGMKSTMFAAQSIMCGDAEIVVAGGMENMSLAPHYAYLRSPIKLGSSTLIDGMQRDGLTDAFDNQIMGIFGDLCATEHKISREEQDVFAAESYKRAANAWEKGLFANEVVPVTITQDRAEPKIVARDEEYSRMKLDRIPSMPPAFTKDGTVTAANSSKINDGASALIIMTEEKAKELGLKPLAFIKNYADAEQEPKYFPTTPAKAVTKALEKAKLSLKDVDFFEFHEAFSVVGLVNMKLLNINHSKVNVNGGAVALGHPLGCAGARIIVTLLNVMEQNNGKIGVAAVCNGGGGASAIVLEKYEN